MGKIKTEFMKPEIEIEKLVEKYQWFYGKTK